MIVLDIETTGLIPSPTPVDMANGITEDFIVAIGVMDEFAMQIFTAPYYIYKTSLAATEREILDRFSEWFSFTNQKEPATLLSYNGKSFDIPFITSKLIRYGLPEAESLLSAEHIDLMEYTKHVTGKRLSKDDSCRKLGNLYVPRKTEGLWNARIYKNAHLLSENEHIEMIQHNATDLSATMRLYNVVKNFPDFSDWMEARV